MSGDQTTIASVSPSGARAKLRGTVDAFPGQGFAIVDGGHFDDLPALFKKTGLFARSLFLDTADVAVQAAGPWLVQLDQSPDTTEKVFILVGEKPAVVFWCCADGEMVLWRHLRGLNMARIPVWAANGLPRPPDDFERQSEPVIFRHWDPRVLGELLPVLNLDQFARILGPSGETAFVSTDFGGCRRIVRRADWPAASHSMLAILPQQIDQLGIRHNAARHARMMVYLRATATYETSAMSDEELKTLVQRYEISARKVGLTHERSQSIWCFLMAASKGRFETLPKVRAYLKASTDPDADVETLLHHMARLAKTNRAVA